MNPDSEWMGVGRRVAAVHQGLGHRLPLRGTARMGTDTWNVHPAAIGVAERAADLIRASL
jgi:hypothetical protein